MTSEKGHNIEESRPKKGRNPQFSETETKILLSIWGQPEKQSKFKSFSRHSAIWEGIASELYQQGIDGDDFPNFPRRKGSNLKDRVTNLKKTYTQFKSKQSSGCAAPSSKEFPYWNEFEKVLGTRDCMTSVHAVDSMSTQKEVHGTDNDTVSTMNEREDHPSESPTLPADPDDQEVAVETGSTPVGRSDKQRKRKRDDENETLLSQLLEVQKSNLKINEQRLKQEEGLTAAMTKFFQSGSNYFDSKAMHVAMRNTSSQNNASDHFVLVQEDNFE